MVKVIEKISMKNLNLYTLFILMILSLFMVSQPSLAYDQPWDQGHDTAKNDKPDDPGPPDDPINCGDRGRGSPVYVATGHFVWSESDISLTGRPALSVNRTYNSHDPRDGIFGNGWSSNCEPLLNKVTDTEGKISYIYVAVDGKRYTYTQSADGSFQSPDGHFDTLNVSATDATLTSPSGSFFRFNSAGKITHWSNSNGLTRDYEYDSNGLLVKMTAGANSLSLSYNSNGHVSNIQDHTGRQWSYAYDANGNLISVTDPLGNIRSFIYQAYADPVDGHTYYQLKQVDDASGKVVIATTYNKHRVASYTERGNVYTYSFDTNSKTATKRDSSGRNYTYLYNDHQIIIQKTDPLGNTVKFEYDKNGNITKFTDQAGKDWTSTFDTKGRKLTATTPLGRTYKWEYTGSNPKPSKITSPEGNTSIIAYDAKLNPVSITDAKGNKVTLTYNAKGDVTSIKDAKGKTTTIAYNAAGLPITVTDAKGNTTTYTYDNLGRKITSTDAEGRITKFEYDSKGRLLKTINALNHVTAYTYDEAGRLLTLTDPVGNITQYSYDTFGRKLKQKRPDGTETSYTYDSSNLLTKIDRYDGKTISLGYDTAMRLASINVDGDTISYAYDARGNQTSISNSTASLSYTYNDDGDLISEDQAGVTLARSYNKDAVLTKLTFLGQTLEYSRDKLNGLSSLKNGTDTFNFSYDANNVLTAISLPNGLNETYRFDDLYNLVKITTGSNTLDYTHDKTGLITSKSKDGVNTAYTYDAIARLTQSGAENYHYDTAGNELGNGSKYDTKTNRLTENATHTFSYDTAGNLTEKKKKDGSETKKYTFNGRNQLIKVETLDQTNTVIKTLSFSYDPLGRRYSKSINGTLKRYVYDGSDIIAILDNNGTTLSTIAHSESVDTPLSITTAGKTYYYHRNHQGSIIALTDSTGNIAESYLYNAYGKVTSKNSTATTHNPYGYTGRIMDDDDLYYYRARYYDPTTQRFVSEDPIGLDAGDMNFYRYVGNSPISLVDPYGLDWLSTLSNYSAGFGDTLSFGLTNWVREKMGTNDVVDKCSGAYSAGEWSGYALEVGMTVASAGLYSTPKTLYHFTTKEAAENILKTGLKVGKNNLYGKGVYATRYNSKILARIQGAASTEVKIIITDTSIFKPTLFPGTFKTPGISVPASILK
jgi:RHS repeat-associated protein